MVTKNQIQKLVKLFTTFTTHLTIYISINVILWLFWLFYKPFSFYVWPFYVSSIWFTLLVIHLLVTYNVIRINEKKLS
jgi:hypothetical protein